MGSLVGIALYITRSLRREIRQSAEELNATAHSLADVITQRSADRRHGILRMGNLRNVSLRVATVQRLVDGVLDFVPEDRRMDALIDVGRTVGSDWGKDFLAELQRQSAQGDLAVRLEEWAEYDAEAGMGRFAFALASDGTGSIILRDSFLSTENARFPLNYFFVGYFEGTLRYLLGKPVTVELVGPSAQRQEEALFTVKAA